MKTNSYPLQHDANRSSSARAEVVLEFGRFRMLLRHRQLLADGVPVELGTRAFDLLLVLLEADGSLLSKEELLSRVWPGIVVSEENLKVRRSEFVGSPVRGTCFAAATTAIFGDSNGGAAGPIGDPATRTETVRSGGVGPPPRIADALNRHNADIVGYFRIFWGPVSGPNARSRG